MRPRRPRATLSVTSPTDQRATMNANRLPLYLLLALLTPSLAWAQTDVQLTETWKLTSGLDRPESVVYDSEQDVLYVSNIKGGGTDKDGNGYLARVAPDGELLDSAWVTGLNAPKGLALVGRTLYVADIDELVEVDVDSDDVVARYEAEGAQFLNDVTADSAGTVYVSDSRTSAVYRLQGEELEVWLEGDGRVQGPNGVHVVGDRLVIAAGDSTAEDPGSARYLQTITLADKTVTPLEDKEPIGGIDAVEPDGQGGYFLTDWSAGKVMRFTPSGEVALLKELSQGTADLEFVAETEMVFLPVMESNELIGYRVEGLAP